MFITPERRRSISSSTAIPIFGMAARRNQRNIHCRQFVECFYGYHTSLSPQERLWEKSKFEKYHCRAISIATCSSTARRRGHRQSTYLKDFYKNGFNTIERNAEVAQRYPERFIVNGSFDPRDGQGARIHLLDEGDLRHQEA